MCHTAEESERDSERSACECLQLHCAIANGPAGRCLCDRRAYERVQQENTVSECSKRFADCVWEENVQERTALEPSKPRATRIAPEESVLL